MNEKYLQDLYGWIKGEDDTYESRYDYDTFKQKMQDPEYAKSMHGWISSRDESFNERRPLDAFIQQVKTVPSKKKFGSELTSQEADVESTSKPTQQNTSLGTNQQEEAQGSDTLDGLKPFDPLEGLIDSQQKTIKETTPAVTKQVQPTEEEDYFTGGFGNFLRGVDDIIPLGIGDFVDDMARGVASGYRGAQSDKAAGNLIVSGTNPSDEEITQFIESRKLAEEMKPSDEMNNYQRIYEEEGKGFWGVVKGLANNPSILPELLLSSLTRMATNTDALKAGVATIIAGGSIGAATGATGGSVVPVVGTGIGAGAGAIAGAEAAIPFAFGAASSVVEMGSTFGELLQEELGDKEMSKENVRAVLENPEKMQSIRNKAIARGLVIGTIDAFTGKLATGVGAKILTKSAAKSATGAVTRAATTKAVAAGAAVESLGGSFGETAARAAIGQDMDISEIALEGLAELPGGIRSTIQAKFAKPSYRVNGEKVTAEDIDELTRTMTPEQLYATKIVIKNDYEGRQFKIQDKIVTNSIKEDVRRANPELNEPSLNAITQLEKDLQGLEGNKTQTGKDKASAIRTQIKNIQENQLQDEAASEYIINEKQYSKENFLKELEGKTPDELKAMKIVVNNDEQTAVNINEKFKTDAIQEQSTTTIPVQSETTTSETMETGISESGPEVLTEEEVDIDLTLPKNKDNIVVADSSNGFILVDSDTNQPIEVFNDNAGENSGISKPYATQEEAQSRIEGLKQPPQEVVAEAPVEALKDVESTAKALELNDKIDIELEDFYKKISESKNKDMRVLSNMIDNVQEKKERNSILNSSLDKISEVVDNIFKRETYILEKKEGREAKEVAEKYQKEVSKQEANKDFKDAFFGNPSNWVADALKMRESVRVFQENGGTLKDLLSSVKNEFKSDGFTEQDAAEVIKDKLESLTKKDFRQQQLSEAYHEAKADGSNPELVKAVEELLVSSKTQPTTQTQTNETTNELQPEPTGNGGTRRTAISKTTPLEGAPKVQGATGPDQQLVSVAEKYAAENGIDLKRQGEYAEVNEERAKRIADAYEEMANDPENPKVKEAYAELIKQTKAQYQALVDAGYKFWFIDLNNPENIDYISSPFNSMRDLRQNKQIGVFPTDAGFGSDENVDVSKNPLLEDTGITWAIGGVDGTTQMPVTANDLFRAVHDAFGHGLEGAGFRAEGEENAWQSHVRLFTGSAIGAMTSETRGQNSWVNYGPYGEQNRTANAEDTVFADQKVGLMPEFTWTEGRVSDMETEQTVAEEVGTQGLSEAEIPGYDRMISEVEGIVEKSKKRRVSEAKMLDNVMSYVTGSKVYENATDVQREALVRKIRKDFGLREKSAPSVAKLFGKIKDVTKITITEKQGLIKQIKDTAKGAREAVKAFKLASQQLTKDIKELKESGKITSTQLANVLVKFSKVNVLNDASVSNFVDYMTKVFTDADYINKIETAKSNLKTAKKNIVTKLGIADGLILQLQRLFAINPTMIPDAYLGKYLNLVDMFGKRQAVLTLEEKSQTIKDVQEILDEINNEKSLVDELADRFNNSDNKVFKDDKLDYSASLNKMLEEGDIDNEGLVLMKKYKTDIVPQVEKSKLTEEEIQAEKDELTKIIKKSKIDGTELSTRDERKKSKELDSLIKGKAINELTNVELKNLLKVIDNINNGYFPHYAQLMIEKLNEINNSNPLEGAINKSKPLPISKLYAKAKSILTKKDAVLEMIRRNPLFNIDQVLGDFKTKDIFNSLFNKAAEAEAKFTSELKNVQALLEKAEEKVAKSFKLDANKTLMSKFKMMTYMVQLEHDSNPDNKQVNPAAEYLKATIKHIEAGKSQFGERDSDMLQEIYDKYTDSEGNIDNEKLFNSFNDAEKEAIKTVRGINESLKEKAEHTGAIIRGQKINPLNNYVHLNVLHEYKPNDLASGESFANDYNNSMRPSTKAKSLIERTGKVSPLNFDIFTSAQRGAKFVLMDYHLTEPIRTARKTMNRTISNMESKGKIPKEKRQIINAINNAFEEAIENLVVNNYTETSFGDDVADYVSKQGYRAVLAGTGRFASEFLSNVGFVLLSDPTAFTEGVKYTDVIMSEDAPIIMSNLNAKETNRIFPTDTLSGRMIDSNIINQSSGIKGNKSKNVVANKIQQIYNLSGKKYVNSVELLSDILISTPDKLIMRPIWFGSFAYNFKKITGTEVDFKKIAANDETYMDQNKEALEKAKTIADERSVITGSSNNAFTGILKGTSKPNQSITTKAFNNFNSFMTKFMVYEFVTARTGIMAAMGNGSLTKKQGVALLGAAVTRMTVYSLLIKALGSGIIGLLFDDDDDEEDKKAPEKAVGQALASTFSSMLLGRDFGNISKTIINYGVEQVNENYLDFLREGDYDPYKDALQYSVVTPEKKGTQTGVYDLFKNMTGSYGPAIKTADLVLKKAFEDEKQDAAAIERQEKEKNVRIPLEVLGNLGLVPLYKEIRKSVIKDIYKKTLQEKQEEQVKIDMFQEQLDKAVTPEDIDIATEALNRVKNPKLYEAEKETIKNMKESLLTNEETGITYDNISDVKKYDRPLWEKNFGPDSEWYQVTKGEREVKKLIKQKETEAEEEKFNYVKPKRKSKNSDGTYKKSSSSRSRVKGFGGSSSSSSSSTTERYDSRGVKITTKKSRSRVKGFN